MNSSGELGKERWFWIVLRILNQLLNVPKLGKTPKPDLAKIWANKIVLGTWGGYMGAPYRGLHWVSDFIWQVPFHVQIDWTLLLKKTLVCHIKWNFCVEMTHFLTRQSKVYWFFSSQCWKLVVVMSYVCPFHKQKKAIILDGLRKDYQFLLLFVASPWNCYSCGLYYHAETPCVLQLFDCWG